MKLFKSWLLPATCTIILVVTTYATSTEAAKQKQAEISLQHQQQQQQYQQQFDVGTAATDVVPLKPLKYGDKTTKKIPNGEVLLLPTTPSTVNKNYTNGVANSRSGQRSRKEYIELPTNRPTTQIPRRYDSGSIQSQLVVPQHDIPIVQKNRELFNKPIATTVGQHSQPQQHQQQQQQQQQQRQRIQQNTNRSRSQSTITTPTRQQQQQQQLQQQHQPTQLSNLNFESEKTVAKTKTITTTTMTTTQTTAIARQPKQRQHRFNETTTSSRNFASTASTKPNNNHPPPKSRNANSSSFSTSQLTHHQNRSNLNNSNNNKHNVAIETNSSKNARAPRPPLFQFPNNFNFNIFTPEFWQFLSPTTSPAPHLTTRPTTTTQPTTKKPPKKYRPPTQISTKEEKLNLVKPKQNIPSRTSSTTTTKKPEPIQNNNNNNIIPPKRDDGPFRIALPTFNILSSRRETFDDSEKGKRNVEGDTSLRERFDCPRESEVRFQLFPKICKIDEDCKIWNREEICCEIFGAKSCVTGLPKPLEETSHAPILGVIPRKCPSRPLAELWWEVKECETDMDCWPRVCCPDGRRRYCRTSQPELSTVPVPVKRSFNYLSEYLECTPPPPPIFDLHPKTCTSTLDCFPNVCCQEAGLRHCRPPKKSVLTMLANVFNVDFVKRLTQNIVIK